MYQRYPDTVALVNTSERGRRKGTTKEKSKPKTVPELRADLAVYLEQVVAGQHRAAVRGRAVRLDRDYDGTVA